MGFFEEVSPGCLGIDAGGIESFIERADRAGLELHRMMILRHGKCCARFVWEPYSENDLHPLYSFSKSLTAAAVGFARQEGLLDLDERVADIFPDQLPKEPDENLMNCTLHHLLTMSCGHETEIEDRGPDWLRSFFAHPFLHAPGTFYKYNTAGTNILAAVIAKRSGMQVTDCLRSRLFDPLGIGEVACACLPDKDHTQMGGSGMSMTLEDMAKFTQFMLNDGCWEGKKLLNDWFFTRAGKKQIDTAGDSEGHIKDWAMGYGYQCWMGTLKDSFRADGAYGQFGLVYPTLDMGIIINACTEQTQTMLDLVNECILPGVGESTGDSGEAMIRTYSLPALKNCHDPVFEKQLEKALYVTEEGGAMPGLDKLAAGAGLFGGWSDDVTKSIRFSFGEEHVLMTLTGEKEESAVWAAMNNSFALSEINDVRYAATARWRGKHRLEMEIRRLDAMSGVRLILNFEDDRLWFEAEDTLISQGGLGIVPRQTAVFYNKEMLN